MSKSIRSFPAEVRERVAEKRAAAKTGGLGFLAALDFLRKQKPKGEGNAPNQT